MLQTGELNCSSLVSLSYRRRLLQGTRARERFYLGGFAPVNKIRTLKTQSVTPERNRGIFPATLEAKIFRQNATVRNVSLY